MHKIKYCLDTNVISDLLRGIPNVVANFNRARNNNDTIFVDSIVYYEIVRGLQNPQHKRRLEQFRWLYDRLEHLYFDRDNMRALDKAAEIYDQLRKGRNVEDSDIFIAAIAMVNGCTLVTANEQHFSRIEGLRYVNWRN